MSLAPGRRLGPYEIVAPLGAGGMGEVFRARDTRLGRDVAIKVLPEGFSRDPDRRARFEREARAVAALSHPHIVALHDFGEEEGTAYAVSELLEGETLRVALRRGPLPVRKAVEQGVQIARGLAAAHEKGIVHRDLKPENVFVTTDGQLKILDFGLVRQEAPRGPVQSEVQTLTHDTAPGVVLGTVGYMSPEQVQGLAADHRSDVFALGCVLYEMLTGRRAFERPTAAETMTAILREDPPAFSTTGRPLPAALERTVHRCLEKSPAERFQSARDVAFALEALSGESSTAVAAETTRVARRRFLSWGAVALPAAAAGALGYVVGGQRGGMEKPRPSFKRLTFRRGPILSARFGPDGRTVYYGAAWEGGPFRVYQTRREGGELTIPIENADLLSVARDGRLAVLLVKRSATNAWWKKGTLAVVAAAGGAPRELAEDVRGADFSPDGRALAVVRDGSGRSRLEYPLERVLYELDGHICSPRVSADGERVAFFESWHKGGVSLAAVDRSGRRSVLVDGWADWYDLAWSAHGREIWFAATRPCAGTTGSLHAVGLGGRRRVLFEAPGALDIHDLSPDGTALITQVQNRTGIRGWAAEGGAERELSWRDGSSPIDLTPDGRTLLFLSVTECSGGEQESGAAFVRALDGSAPVRVAEGGPLAISPDGRFALIQTQRELRLTPTGAGEARVLVTDVDGVLAAKWMPGGGSLVLVMPDSGRRVRLHRADLGGGSNAQVRPASAAIARDCPYTFLGFTVSPDSRQVAMSGADGRILLVPLDGGAPRPLPGGEVNEQPVQWSTDGRLLYCYRRGQMPARVFEVDVATGRRRLWATIQPPTLAATEIALLLSRDLQRGVYGYDDVSTDLYLVDGLR